jgi:hypothetical protein
MQYFGTQTASIEPEAADIIPTGRDLLYRGGKWGIFVRPRGAEGGPSLYLDFGDGIYKQHDGFDGLDSAFEAWRPPASIVVQHLAFHPSGTQALWNGVPLNRQGLPNRITAVGLPRTRGVHVAFAQDPTNAQSTHVVVTTDRDEMEPTPRGTKLFVGGAGGMGAMSVYSAVLDENTGTGSVHTREGILRWKPGDAMWSPRDSPAVALQPIALEGITVDEQTTGMRMASAEHVYLAR